MSRVGTISTQAESFNVVTCGAGASALGQLLHLNIKQNMAKSFKNNW